MAIRQLSFFAEWEKDLQVKRSVLASNPQLYEILVGELLMKHSDNLVSVSKGQQVASMKVDPLEGIRGDEQFDIILDKGHQQSGS